MSTRVKWIDVAKGLGAIFVVLGHFILNGSICILLYAFHMPLFFFLAGITLNIKENERFCDYFKKKFTSIIFPYFIFSIPLFLYSCIRTIHHSGNDIFLSIIKRIIGVFVCWKTTDYYNSVWFLPCIFMAYLISYIIIKNAKSNVIILVSAFVALVAGFILDTFNITLPWCIDTALIGFFFMGIAYISKSLISKAKSFHVLLYLPMSIIAFYNNNMSGKRIEMFSNDYGNYVLFVLASLCGIWATIGLANISIFKNNSLLNCLGKESMYMYGAQLLFFNAMTAILPKIGFYSLNLFVQTMVGLVISCFMVFFLLKINPWYHHILNKIITKL